MSKEPSAAPERNCLVIAGPNASGKTALGVSLALDLGGEILSADSRQVYRGMDLGAGKDLGEYDRPEGSVPVHLVDIAEPRERYSLFRYQGDFYRAFAEVCERRRLPIVVGGTGLYLEASLGKWPVPDVPPDEPYRRELMARELDDLVEELRRRAPALLGRTVLDCKRRVVRALEIARHTELHGPPAVQGTDLELRPLLLVVTWPRERLRERIRRRLLTRLEGGLVEEVRRLLASGIPRERYDLFGMEYRHVARYLEGEVSRERMIDDLARDIAYLARRQETYFRGMRKRGLETHEVEEASLERAREIISRYRLVPSGRGG